MILTLALLGLAQLLAQRLKQAGALPRQIEGAVNAAIPAGSSAALSPLQAEPRLVSRRSAPRFGYPGGTNSSNLTIEL
jgi:hypothetical protein